MDNFYVISLQVLTKKKQNTRRVYQDSQLPTCPHPTPPTLKVTTNLNLTCKNIKFKIKNKSNTSSCYRKNQILSLQEDSLMFLQTITSSLLT